MKNRLTALLLIVLAGYSGVAYAERIAVIGTGDVAGALGPRFAGNGHDVVYGSRRPESESAKALVDRTGHGATAALPAAAAAAADIIVMAVPAEVAVDVLIGLGDTAGKIVIDPSNAFEFTDDNLAYTTIDSSMGELLQAAAPDARVVKALNAVWYRTMADPDFAGGPVTIPMVGDDAAAKATVSKLLGELGFEAVDLGPIRYAREVEGMLILWMNARRDGRPFNYYLRPETGGN